MENRVLSVEEAGKTLASYSYTRGGKVASITSGDIETTYTYDSAGNTTAITTTIGGELFGTLTYRYDDRGNCISKNNGSQNITYTYDGLNRLTGEERAEGSASTKYLYRYDKAGNRMSMEILGTDDRQHVEYTYNSLNQLTMCKDVIRNTESIFSYDLDGNMTSDNRGIYSYDDFDHMTRAEMSNGDLFTCCYDAEGLRHEVEENGKLIQYIYSGRDVILEETPDENIRYIRGNGRLIVSDSDKARCYYHYVSDQLGSVGYVLDGDTTKTITDRIKCHYEYDAFGNTIVCEENIHNPFRFTGEQYDAVTNLYYLRARYYNPVIGRFTQQDTYLGDGLNLYAYVQNNPVKYVDPSGHAKQLGVPDKSGKDVRFMPESYYSYNELKKAIKDKELSGSGIGFEAHHLLEKQYAKKFGVEQGDIISVALTPKWHRGVNGEKIIGEGVNINSKIETELMKIVGVDNRLSANKIATPEQIWKAHKKVYENIGHDDWASAVYEAYVKKLGIEY